LAAAEATDLAGRRIAVSEDWGFLPVDPQVRRIFRAAVERIASRLDVSVETSHPGFPDMQAAFWGVVALDTDLRGFRAVARDYRHEMSPHLIDFLDRAWQAEDLTDAVQARKRVYNAMWPFMRRYDLLLTPTLSIPAIGAEEDEPSDPRYAGIRDWKPFVAPFNLTCQPAASLPVGVTRDGLPVGLQVVGPLYGDKTVLDACHAYEAAFPFPQPDLARLAEWQTESEVPAGIRSMLETMAHVRAA
jgi:aspartyl-tRNA(Asn)/glutamyl-tRNA(Gln) amidotransferase subunit A